MSVGDCNVVTENCLRCCVMVSVYSLLRAMSCFFLVSRYLLRVSGLIMARSDDILLVGNLKCQSHVIIDGFGLRSGLLIENLSSLRLLD